jgi:hypothetical protein
VAFASFEFLQGQKRSFPSLLSACSHVIAPNLCEYRGHIHFVTLISVKEHSSILGILESSKGYEADQLVC